VFETAHGLESRCLVVLKGMWLRSLPTLFPYTTLFRSPSGCSFHPRCPLGRGRDVCHETIPPLADVAQGGSAACHFHTEVEDVKRSEEHTSELQSRENLVCRLLLEKKNKKRREKHMCVQ